jgi:hypothetical protein
MTTHEAEVERLRTQVTTTIKRSTDLLADLEALDERLAVVLPSLAKMAASEREQLAARLCGFDAALPDRLRELIGGLADLLAGLTTSDGGAAWRRHHLDRLASGEPEEAA